MKSYFAFIVLLLLTATAAAQDCSVMKSGKFKHTGEGVDTSAYFIIKGNKHIEYLQNGKYYVESSLKWTSACGYELIVKKCTVPDFPFKPGAKMNVTVNRIDGKKIYYSGDVNGDPFEGSVIKEE